MTIFQIIANILAPKKKKPVKPIVVYTPPTPNPVPPVPTGPKIDPLTGEVIVETDPNISNFNKQIDDIKSQYSHLKYLEIGKNAINDPNYRKTQAGISDLINAVYPSYNLGADQNADDNLKVIFPIYGLISFLENSGPGDNGKDVPGGIFYNYKFFKNGEYYGADKPFKEQMSVGYFKGTWKPLIEKESGLAYDKVQQYFLLFYPLIKNGTFVSQEDFYKEINKIESLIDQGRRNYQDNLTTAIYNIKVSAKKAKDIYTAQDDKTLNGYLEKVRMRTEFYKIKDTINANYSNALANVAFDWVEPIRPISNDNRQEPNPPTTGTGGTIGGQLQGGTQTPTIPTNNGPYPNWVNKDYSPNTTVYYNGHLYNSIINLYGTNNNTPDLDGRWKLIL